ncbi:MAG: OmpA family protein [Planctomycetota bacterium]
MGRLAIIVSALCVLVVFSGCKSANWEKRYLKKEEENRALKEAFDVQNERIAVKDASAEQLRRDMDDTQAEIDALAAELASMEGRPPTQARDSEYEDLVADYERLKKEYGDLVRITEDGNLEITLPASINFASGSYKLTKAGKQTLDGVARQLTNEFSNNKILVIGHTDSDPIRKSPFKDLMELGGERAFEVVRYLATKGVAKSRMTGSSRGDQDPVASNATAAGKKKNRRVEIVVVMPKTKAKADKRN